MNIIDELIPINPYGRPGDRKLRGVYALIIHWTESPGQVSRDVAGYYATRTQDDGYGSAHCGIDPDGSVHSWIPEDEFAYAVGSGLPDTASGKVYTDLARRLFGPYASPNTSPNWITLSAEWMTLDDKGAFTDAEWRAAVELYASWCQRYRLDPMERIITHNQVVGWKDCHRWFVDHPSDLDDFRHDVRGVLG